MNSILDFRGKINTNLYFNKAYKHTISILTQNPLSIADSFRLISYIFNHPGYASMKNIVRQRCRILSPHWCHFWYYWCHFLVSLVSIHKLIHQLVCIEKSKSDKFANYIIIIAIVNKCRIIILVPRSFYNRTTISVWSTVIKIFITLNLP